MKYQNKKNKGFTLIEMMVAIAVFSIVMVMAMGALLNVIDSNNKARSIKTAINNISFALEGISKDMRMGTDYACGGGGNTVEEDCTGGVDTISFKSSKAGNPYVYYRFNTANSQVESCISSAGTGACDGSYSPLTSSELTLDSVKFYVLGVTHSKDPAVTRTQPRVIIVIKGTAGNKNKVKTQTTFDLQTGISQTSRKKI
jgi:prepilin-type N-terminal cleavage/methylation domain-containing protein